MKYSISIACFNKVDVTKKCINYILKNSDNYEIIVVDNGSTDGTAEYLNNLNLKNLNIITNVENKGFGEAHNQALEIANGEYFVVLNNDVFVCDSWLIMLKEALEKNNWTQIGAKNFSNYQINKDLIGYKGRCVEYVEGSCMMMRTVDAKKFKLFSPKYKKAYFEDADLSLRIRQKGLEIGLVDLPGAKHLQAATASNSNIDIRGYWVRNAAIFRHTWKNYLEHRDFRRRILVKRGGSHGDVYNLLPVIKALKREYPMSEITLQSNCCDILRSCPYVSHYYPASKSLSRFDNEYNFDLVYERKPGELIFDAYAEITGLKLTDYSREFTLTDIGKKLVDHFKRELGDYCVIHTGKTWKNREWSFPKFQQVSNYFKVKGLKIVEVGDSSTHFCLNSDKVLKNQPWENIAACLKSAKFFLGVDSSVSNLALAQKTPSFILFGCVDPKTRIAPGDPGVPVYAKDVGCLFCRSWMPAPSTFTECQRKQPWCMKKISPAMVIDAIENYFPSDFKVVEEEKEIVEEISVEKIEKPIEKPEETEPVNYLREEIFTQKIGVANVPN